MAALDVMPFEAGENKPTARSFRIGALTTNDTEDSSWLVGNWMVFNAGADDIDALTDGTDDPVSGNIFVSTTSSRGEIQSKGLTSGAATHAARTTVLQVTKGAQFITKNAFNGDDTNIGPAGTNTIGVGDTGDVWVSDATSTLAGHIHGLDTSADYFTVTRVLDANKEDTYVSGATAAWLVFERLE